MPAFSKDRRPSRQKFQITRPGGCFVINQTEFDLLMFNQTVEQAWADDFSIQEDIALENGMGLRALDEPVASLPFWRKCENSSVGRPSFLQDGLSVLRGLPIFVRCLFLSLFIPSDVFFFP